MALHRDIYWVGKQWTVTGFGLQLIDQRRKGEFDVEFSRLWENDLLESMRTRTWLNDEDFAKGLSMARARYPRPLHQQELSDVKVGAPAETAKPMQTEKPPIEFQMKIQGRACQISQAVAHSYTQIGRRSFVWLRAAGVCL